MQLFVTGGTGFFGKALLRYWQTDPAITNYFEKITFLSRNPDDFKLRYAGLLSGLNVDFHRGDIMSPASLPTGQSFSHIMHAATDSTMGPQLIPLERYLQIVKGTQNLLDFAVKNNTEKFLLTSSGGVYGSQPHDMTHIPESYCGLPDPLNPNSAYGVGKRSAEHLCTLYAEQYGFDFVVARCFAFVGEDLPLDVHFAIGNFLRNVLNKEDIVIQGDGMALRSYMDQRDLSQWLSTFLLTATKSKVYNVGSDESISIKDLALLLHQVTNATSQIKILGKPAIGAAAQRNQYIPDISRAKELRLSNKYSLSDSILYTFEKLRSNN